MFSRRARANATGGSSLYHVITFERIVMNVPKDTVVSLRYTLRDDDGTLLDSTDGREPLEYLHGHHNIIPGLEQALEGTLPGFKDQITVPPELAYGDIDPSARFEIPRDKLPPEVDIEVGMNIVGEHEGEPYKLTVTDVDEDRILLDGNHPLAGVNLHFDILVENIRTATAEELAQGYPEPKVV